MRPRLNDGRPTLSAASHASNGPSRSSQSPSDAAHAIRSRQTTSFAQSCDGPLVTAVPATRLGRQSGRSRSAARRRFSLHPDRLRNASAAADMSAFRKVRCHCTTCKNISGGAGTVSGRCDEHDPCPHGRDLLTSFQPGGTSRTFCSACGAKHLRGRLARRRGRERSAFGTLDDPYERKPDWRI